MQTAGFAIKTETFEGPLDLLLHLIEKRQFFINDIALAKVTDDFIAYIQERKDMPMGEVAQFIVVASTLLLIKSKSLLPVLDLTEEEEGSIEDLEKRLKEYQKIKELSLHVKERFGKEIIFAKQGKFIEPVFSPSSEISLKSITESIQNLVASFPIPKKLPKTVVKKVMSLEEMIERLIERVQKSIKMSFKEFSGGAGGPKDNIIISFLAVLELMKRGILEAEQSESFSDIQLKTSNEQI